MLSMLKKNAAQSEARTRLNTKVSEPVKKEGKDFSILRLHPRLLISLWMLQMKRTISSRSIKTVLMRGT